MGGAIYCPQVEGLKEANEVSDTQAEGGGGGSWDEATRDGAVWAETAKYCTLREPTRLGCFF